MRTLAGWCVHHRRLVLLIWAIVLIASFGLMKSVGTAYTSSFTLPHTESTDAIKLLQAAAPKVSGDTEQIVFATSGGVKVTDPSVEASINTMIGKVEALPHVTQVTSPYSAEGAHQINEDQTVAFVTVTLDQQANNLSQSEAKEFVSTATSAAGPHLQVAVSGLLAEDANKPSIGGTGLGVLLALVVLLVIFGSVFAAVLPLVSALFALGTAVDIVGMLSHVLKMPVFSPELVLLIGLGVGVDYALFIVTRHRQGLVAGRDTESSIINAVNTSGRAVLCAGIIVCIALLGMLALGVSFLYGLAVAASIGVLLTMIAALTLLPALLGFIGPKVMSRSQKKNLAENGPRIVGADSRGFWPRWADRIQRRPAVSGAVALIIVVVIALPVLLPEAGLGRPGQRSHRDDDPDGLRPAGQGIRTRLQRAAPAGHRRFDAGAEGRHHDRGRRREGCAGRGQRDPAHLLPEQDRGRRRRHADQRLPDDLAAGGGHHGPRLPPAPGHDPRSGGRQRAEYPGGWQYGHLRGLRQRPVGQTASLHRLGGDPVVHPA